MQNVSDPRILQTTNDRGQADKVAVDGRQAVCRIPSNHRQAERKLISLIEDGTFEIDELGQIWRLKKKLGCRWHGTKIITVPRKRAEHRTPAGYLQVRAMLEGKRVHGLAHRLVWQFFHGEIPDGMVINHKNGVKDDNRPENLEVVTYSENMKHAFKTGLKTQYGEDNPNNKLTDIEVVKLRELYATDKYLMRELAEQFGIHLGTVSQIVRGDRRSLAGGPLTRKANYSHFRRRGKHGRFVVGSEMSGRAPIPDDLMIREFPE